MMIAMTIRMGMIFGMFMINRRALCMAMGAAMSVRPALRREGGVQLFNICPKQTQHIFKHMILLDQKMALFYLAWGVTVAYMPSDTRQIIVSYFQQRFWFRLDGDDAPIIQFKPVCC